MAFTTKSNGAMPTTTTDEISNLSPLTGLSMSAALAVPTVVEGNISDSNNKKRRRLLDDGGDDDKVDGIVMPQKPKRPLSAYNLFFRHQRSKSIQVARKQDVDKASATGFDESRKGAVFQNLAKHVGRMWRDLPAEEKVPFEERAAEEKRRYDEKMIRWRMLGGHMGLVRAVTASSPSLSQLPFYPHSSTTAMAWPHTPTRNATFSTITATPLSQSSRSEVMLLSSGAFLPHAELGMVHETAPNLPVSGGTRDGGLTWCPVTAQEDPFPFKTKETPAFIDSREEASALNEYISVLCSSTDTPDDTAKGSMPRECTPLPFHPSSSPSCFASDEVTFGRFSTIRGGESIGIDYDDTFWSDSDVKSLLQTLGSHCCEVNSVGEQRDR